MNDDKKPKWKDFYFWTYSWGGALVLGILISLINWWMLS